MFQDFSVSTINIDPRTKSIDVVCSFDVDPTTVNDSNVQLLDRASKNIIECQYSVVGKDVLITLIEWPAPNVDYVLRIQNLKSIIGDPLSSGIRRKITFETAITSVIEITYPAFDEVISNLKIAWVEKPIPETTSLVNSYYIEISNDIGFHNITRQLTVQDRTDVDISDLLEGQYYVRGRVQKDEDYGAWCEVITFLIKEQTTDPTPDQPDNGQIYVPDLIVLSIPNSGLTPTSIMIEFDLPIDPLSLGNIVVIRRGAGTELVQFTTTVISNFIDINPLNGVLDNSVYEIELKDIKSADGVAELEYEKITFATAVKPAYADILSVESLVDSCKISVDKILYNIREASRFADFVNPKFDHVNIPFEVEQFVRYKAAHDCLLKFYIDRASVGGQKGQVGDVLFENKEKLDDISELLKTLERQMKFWMDALRGYVELGRAKPVSAVRAIAPRLQTAVGTGGRAVQPLTTTAPYSRY